MTPINTLPPGTFCRLDGQVVYIYKNNFRDCYGVCPISGLVAQNKPFDIKVYVYKRIKKVWISTALKAIEDLFEWSAEHELEQNTGIHMYPDKIRSNGMIDNLQYVENLDILKKL